MGGGRSESSRKHFFGSLEVCAGLFDKRISLVEGRRKKPRSCPDDRFSSCVDGGTGPVSPVLHWKMGRVICSVLGKDSELIYDRSWIMDESPASFAHLVRREHRENGLL